MAYLIGPPFVVLLAMVQSAILSNLGMLGGRPDLVLIAVIAWGITGRSHEAMTLGLIGGLFLDLLSGLPLGSTAIILICVAYLVSLFEARFWEAHLLMPLAVTLIGSLIYHFLGLSVILLTGRGIDLTVAATRVILPSTFFNLILALPAAQLAKAIHERFYPPEVSI